MEEKNDFNIAVLVGSLRKDSLSLKMAKALIGLAPGSLHLKITEIGTLPLYNEDLETSTPPEEWQKFRNTIRPASGLLFITPEYNRSVPAALKNALDVGSAPQEKNVFENKPAAIVSVSAGKMGAFGANHHLRQSLVFLNIPAMPQPEAYIGSCEELFDPRGRIINEGTHRYLILFMKAFANWVKTYSQGNKTLIL